MPKKLDELIARLQVYQETAVPVGLHKLVGINCTKPSPASHPEWGGFWMPFCAAAAPEAEATRGVRLGEEAIEAMEEWARYS